jgi:KaiC/GvpD/RAD55 family RecA-like ATPase
MLQKGVLDAGLLTTRLSGPTGAARDVVAISQRLASGFPDPPAGIGIDSLRLITRATGGLYGLWAIAGEPGVGKTALSWQIALDVGQKLPVIYYDHENGFEVLMDRTKKLTGGNLDRAKELTRMVYHRDSIRSLDSDLGVIAPPAVLVVDPVQKLPGSLEFKRASIDRWVHKLEHLKKRGYHVIMISEVPRSQYGQDAYIGAFKESGEVEYSADTAIQLLPGREGGSVEVHIVKNRHRPMKGFAALLSRVNDWRFRELGQDNGVPV